MKLTYEARQRVTTQLEHNIDRAQTVEAVADVLRAELRRLEAEGAVMVTSRYPDGNEESMTITEAVEEMAGAMDDDYRNSRWGGIYDDDGNEIPVVITVEPSPAVDLSEVTG